MRVLLVVAYDGTNYHGWQCQPNAVTIEGILNEKLSELLGENIEVIGASRTDAGVHAEGNVAVFDTNTNIPAEKISYALNHSLPEDIVIQESYEVEPDFHPRKCDSIKTYQYRILNRNFNLPVKGRNAYHFHRNVDIDKMREAASYFVGRHDFKNFCSSHTQAKSTVRIIYSLDIEEEDDEIVITVSGNGFLYNMVRTIIGTLLYIEGHNKTSEFMKEVLDSKDRTKAGRTVSPYGLTLMKVEY